MLVFAFFAEVEAGGIFIHLFLWALFSPLFSIWGVVVLDGVVGEYSVSLFLLRCLEFGSPGTVFLFFYRLILAEVEVAWVVSYVMIPYRT